MWLSWGSLPSRAGFTIVTFRHANAEFYRTDMKRLGCLDSKFRKPLTKSFPPDKPILHSFGVLMGSQVSWMFWAWTFIFRFSILSPSPAIVFFTWPNLLVRLSCEIFVWLLEFCEFYFSATFLQRFPYLNCFYCFNCLCVTVFIQTLIFLSSLYIYNCYFEGIVLYISWVVFLREYYPRVLEDTYLSSLCCLCWAIWS